MTIRKDDADGHDFDARKRYDFDGKALEDAGLQADREEERDRVLVWLE